MYSFLKKILFLFNPEKAHHITFAILKFPFVAKILGLIYKIEHKKLERTLFGITFKNPVGLAAGLDKNALAINEFAQIGFGFVEIGTVTPLPQIGNDKPRLFRLTKNNALLNRMGFNNDGAEIIAKRLYTILYRNKKHKAIIGGNIGKNKITPNENAVEDYKICFEKLFDVVDYFVVNVSSPNTPNLRALQDKAPLMEILNAVMDLNRKKNKPKPILLKIAPDLNNNQLDDIIEIVKETKIQGVIATNTTIDRTNLSYTTNELETLGAGGISGASLKDKSNYVIKYLKEKSNHAFPIIGVGGIETAQDALDKINAGADLVQLYTGFIYKGPQLIKDINKAILKNSK